MTPELIVMLTHNDRTVSNAIAVFEGAKGSKASYWGFKEVGIPLDEMKTLASNMKKAGKTVCLEVVAYTEEECMAGAAAGVACGVDILMGTLYFPSIGQYLKVNNVKYMPFVGKISGRPTVMEGTIEDTIIEGLKLSVQDDVYGIDLLGYRFLGDAHSLNKRFCAALACPVCIAGSINDFSRLDAVIEFGAFSYTIGSAFFDEKFGKGESFGQQIDKVINYMDDKCKF